MMTQALHKFYLVMPLGVSRTYVGVFIQPRSYRCCKVCRLIKIVVGQQNKETKLIWGKKGSG